ncbi:rRNA maturation RNase YbeY [Flavobacterium sp.]|uniref:rRNA maturation RNase YbeY n=1 Tax=Flavobacterium sp. TaxID=239 RepID=UPI002617E41E|nr:rRNA maturation RNase YbeY [Flavobacterium sp.]
MIEFHSETDFELTDEKLVTDWILRVAHKHGKAISEISYVFCTDEYLLDMNQRFLNHDTLTDIITFDYTVGNEIGGDVFISTERVAENAVDFGVEFIEELRRVIIHGVLHLCGFKDKSEDDEVQMRKLEDEALEMFHVEH